MLENVRKYAMEKFAGDKESVDEFVKGFVKVAMANNAGGNPSAKPPSAFEQMKLDLENKKLGLDSMKHGLDFQKYKLDSDTKTGLGPLTSGFMSETGKGLSGLLMTLGVAGVGSVYKGIHRKNLHSRFMDAIDKAIASNENIRNAGREKVMAYANTVFKFAPNVATDVNVLSAVISNAIQGDVIDTNIIKALTDLEGRYTENFSFSPKTYI